MKISSIANIITAKIDGSLLTPQSYISTENMIPNCGGIVDAASVPTTKVTSFSAEDTLLSNIRPYFKKVWFAKFDGGCSNDVICIRANGVQCLPKYLYYALCTDNFIDLFSASSKGTKMPRGDKNALLDYEIPDRTIDEQQHIVGVLGTLDDKIENNLKIISKLEVIMQHLFDEFLVNSSDWHTENLTTIAEYTNGLAMQKYRPKGEEYLPVIKIKELSQGYVDNNTEQADTGIDRKFIVDDGDIVFSWSGTLMVKIWCGGKGGLNQHLFKVTSKNYPKWFIYLWTKYHLTKFQNIAQGKAVTMGHIKREDLAKSSVKIPSQDILNEYDKQFALLFERIIELSIENRKLNELKQLYLQKFFG